MTKNLISKRDGMFYGATLGYVLGIVLCIICRANHILFDSPMPYNLIFLYALILMIPVSVVGYILPRTMKWVAVIISLLPIP
jgi:hypothetical protein